MIKLTKTEKPNILKINFDSWTENLLSYTSAGNPAPDNVRNKYQHPEIKSGVMTECFGKCMYCESKVSSVYFGDIEHIKPKSTYPELTFEWENLGYVCAQCNSKKGNAYNDDIPFVNPYIDNPSDFFCAMGAFLYHQPGNNRGEYTENALMLNRPALIEARKARIDLIRALLDKAAVANSPLKESILEQVEIEIMDDKPYAFCAKSLYNTLKA